jgi:hypothetical protein
MSIRWELLLKFKYIYVCVCVCVCAIFIHFSINFLISLSQRGHTHICVCVYGEEGGMAAVWLVTKVNKLMPIGILLTPVSITTHHFLNLSWRVALGWGSMQDCEYSASFHGLNTEIYTNKDVQGCSIKTEVVNQMLCKYIHSIIFWQCGTGS